MLLQLRKVTSGTIATIIVGLIGIATVMFLIPQNGLNAMPSQYVAQVKNFSITPRELARDLDFALREQRQNGQEMTQQEAVDAGLHMRALERLIALRSLSWYAQKLGVSASDTQVATMVRQIPAARNPVTGAFDQTAFDTFAQQQNYSRDELLNELRGDLTRGMLMEPLLAGIRAPTSYGNLLFAYATESRVVTIAEAPASAVGRIAPPTDAQLQAFYRENQERLRIPEFRTLTLVYARPADFIPRVNVPEARIREEYNNRLPSISTAEKRSYIRIAAANQAQANDIVARLGRGETPQAIATALHLQVTQGQNEARTEVTDGRVAEAVFAAAPHVARAVQGQLTPWVVIRVESVTPGVTPSFESQRDELRTAIAADEAATLLNTAVEAFEEARAGGTPIAQAATANGLAVQNFPAIEAQGRGADGQPVPQFAGQRELLRTAFETAEGEASDFMPAGDGDVIVAVDHITPTTVRPLAEVREQLVALWTAREGARRLRELGEQVVADVHGGQSFAAAARARGFRVVVSSQPIDRRMAQQIPSQGLAGQIFNSAEGAVVTDIAANGGSSLVAIVEHINRIDPATQPQQVEAARAQTQQRLAQSFGEALQGEIIARAEPRRNERLIDQLYRRSDATTEEPAQ